MQKSTVVRLTKLKNRHPKGYRYTVVYKEGEIRKKKYFKLQKDAKKFEAERLEEVVEHGAGNAVTAIERAAVGEFRDALEAEGLALRDCLTLGLERHKERAKSVTVSEAIRSLMSFTEAQGSGERNLQDLRHRLSRFEKDFGSELVADVTEPQIGDWLQGLRKTLGPTSIQNFRRKLNRLFNYAVSKNWRHANPITKQTFNPKAKVEIGILTPAEARLYITKADIEIVPSIALAMFGGVRMSEVARLTWGDVNFKSKNIRLTKSITKTDRARNLPLKPALLAWLAPYALAYSADDKIMPEKNEGRRLIEEARTAAGFGDDDKKLKPWPNNAARHSAATYALADGQPDYEVARWMGNSTQVLLKNYDKVADADEAAEFYSILPSTKGNIISMGASA